MGVAAPAIEVRDIAKSFGATTALADASFSVGAGSVHALLGENGAGKSTMIKLLSGTIQPDSGAIMVHGERIEMREPRDAHRHGLQTAFQELTFIPHLTVLQNMLLPYQPTGFAWQLRRRAARRTVADYLKKIGLGSIDFRKEARTFGLSVRQKLEIARAIFREPRILFLDEATSALSGADIDWLEARITELKAKGVTIVFITHRLAEVRRFCDEVTILRNGRDVGRFRSDEIDDQKLIELIVGRSLSAAFPPKPVRALPEQPLLSARDLAAGRRLVDCSVDLHAGEILGVSGLQGMGQRELFLALFGALPLTRGSIALDGEPITLGSPGHAIRLGIGLVPEERKTEGLFQNLSGRENVLMSAFDRFSPHGLIDAKAATSAATEAMKRVQVTLRALYTPIRAFSGGNQQKIVIAKWLVAETRILLLFDPTRGVDVGTKREIYQLIHDHADSGGAVMIYSTEIPELVNLCDRVLVMYDGRIAREVGRDGPFDERLIMEAALGQLTTSRSEIEPAAPKVGATS